MKKYIFLIITFTLISIWPYLKSGYIKSHDGEWMVIRFTAFHQSISQGHFPVRIVKRLNNNYGYPVFNYLYPGPFYLAEIFKVLGISFVNSIKLVFILSTLFSALLMFWALRERFSEFSSFVGASLYLFTPYRFFDLYTRGSLGEITAFTFPPIIIGSVFKIAKGNNKYLPVLSLSAAALILSHNVLGIFSLFLLILISAFILERKKLIYVFAFFGLGLLISAFFVVPAISDLRYVKLSEIKVAQTPDYLISPFETLRIFVSHAKLENPFVGLAQLLVLLFSLIIIVLQKNQKLTILLLSISLLIIFMISSPSKILWQSIIGLDIVQFPWRLLSLLLISTSVLATILIDKFKTKFLGILLIILSAVSSLGYTKGLEYTNQPDFYYSTNEDTTTVKDEYLPIWVKEKPASRANTPFENNDSIRVINSEINGLKTKANIDVIESTTFTINTVYFPGYFAKVNNVSEKIDYSNKNGLISLSLPKGTHEVIIGFGKTNTHIISELVSAIALLITTLLLIKLCLKRNF